MRVCHNVAMRARSSSVLSRNSLGVSGLSRSASRRAISRSASRILLRCTSVGCAVSTGEISDSARKLRTVLPDTPALSRRDKAYATLLGCGAEPASQWARRRRLWCWSSAILARCEKYENARTTELVWSRVSFLSSLSSSAPALASDSRRKRTAVWRMVSTTSKTASPSWSRNTSPSRRPSRRMSSLSGASLSADLAAGLSERLGAELRTGGLVCGLVAMINNCYGFQRRKSGVLVELSVVLRARIWLTCLPPLFLYFYAPGTFTGDVATTGRAVLKEFPPSKLVIASRESRLAMWQSEYVRDRLAALYPQCSITILGMTTRGDQILDRTLSKVGGKGLFVKELEVAMEEGRADFAVHCLKDMPMELPPGYAMAAILEREDARDAFVSNDYATLDALPAGAVVGTSSLRRQALIAARFPQLVIKPLRGNLDTRLGKLDRGEYAAIILAAAGLKRLGLTARIRAFIDPEQSLPAPGQGALAIEILSHREDLQRALAPLNHPESALTAAAERTLSRTFGGSCQIPLAAFATIVGDRMHMRALVATPDGKQIASAQASGPADAPEALGRQVADLLQAQGAEAILAACKADAAESE